MLSIRRRLALQQNTVQLFKLSGHNKMQVYEHEGGIELSDRAHNGLSTVCSRYVVEGKNVYGCSRPPEDNRQHAKFAHDRAINESKPHAEYIFSPT